MFWLVSIARPAGDDLADVLIDDLWGRGAVGVEELPGLIRAAFTDEAFARTVADEHGGSVTTADPATGLDAWRDHAAGHQAGPFFVRPPWCTSGGPIDLVIDPGHAFGSGSHPTTRLMLEAIAGRVSSGDTVLDLGAGSGVLSVAAALLGAAVSTVDIDPASEVAVRENAARNGVAELIAARTGDIADVEATCDVALLNATIDIHEQVASHVLSLGPRRLIVSGILAGDQTRRCLALYGADQAEVEFADDEWRALVISNDPSSK